MQEAELVWECGGSVLCEGFAALEAVDGALGVACGAAVSGCGFLERAAATYLATLGEVSVGLFETTFIIPVFTHTNVISTASIKILFSNSRNCCPCVCVCVFCYIPTTGPHTHTQHTTKTTQAPHFFFETPTTSFYIILGRPAEPFTGTVFGLPAPALFDIRP